MTSKTDEDIAEELIRASKIHLTLSYWAAVRKLILAALAAKSAARQEPCAVCGGDGKPVSGRQCICNGTGLLHVAELECRRLIYDLNLKIEKLESAARQDTESAKRIKDWALSLPEHYQWDWLRNEMLDYAARCGLDEGEPHKAEDASKQKCPQCEALRLEREREAAEVFARRLANEP